MRVLVGLSCSEFSHGSVTSLTPFPVFGMEVPDLDLEPDPDGKARTGPENSFIVGSG